MLGLRKKSMYTSSGVALMNCAAALYPSSNSFVDVCETGYVAASCTFVFDK